ncbi:MAG TPA: SMP-30/gluconolactonase/LRE family protein [Dehalococcoidia bacterium]|nr:SMP-30/gluconolactonase/LRE family protein [Dehalococcoidia bacterium]
MAIVAADRRLNDLVDPDAKPEQIATGYNFTEGPVWASSSKNLTFSDVRGDTMYRWTEAEGATVFRRPSQGSNGNTYDRRGRLVTCEHAGRRVSRTAADGSIETVASHYQGNRLNSPNDVVVTAGGDVIFTDPPYGLRQPDGSIVGQEVPFNGVYRVPANGSEITVLADDFERPNGLVLTAGESHLLIADTAREHVRVFELTPGGALTNDRIFVDRFEGRTASGSPARPDGMKLDSLGNLYIAANTSEGVWVFDSAGEYLGTIGLDETPANLAWGGDDWRTLFITATTSVYRLQMKVAGQPVLLG